MQTAKRMLIVSLMLANRAGAQAVDSPPLHRIVHRSLFALRSNPWGLVYEGRFAYQLRLYESPSLALRDNFVSLGVAPTVSPAYLRLGPVVELSPLTIFSLWASAQWIQYFGTFNLAKSFPSASADFSDAAIRATPGAAVSGWELALGANVQLKIASLALRNQLRVARTDLKFGSDEPIFYDPSYDIAAPNRGWYLSDDVDVLWLAMENTLFAGARATFTTPFYEQGLLDGAAPDNSTVRVGPFLGYTFKTHGLVARHTPTVFLLVQWWLKHRHRTGAETSQAIPMVAFGCQVTGDLDLLPISR